MPDTFYDQSLKFSPFDLDDESFFHASSNHGSRRNSGAAWPATSYTASTPATRKSKNINLLPYVGEWSHEDDLLMEAFRREENYMCDPDYLLHRQNNEITPAMRQQLADWLFEVGL